MENNNSNKNLCAKTRPVSNPYEIWQAGGWTWKVLKKYKSESGEKKDPFARWFCHVTSPFCPDGELGDVYVSEIKGVASKISES